MSHHDKPLEPTGLVGSTPLVHLRAFDEFGCRILGKCEFLGPGHSVKDRIGLAMIEDAEREGRLLHGGTVVEGTAGNTGVAVAMVAAAKGYRCILVIPETMAREKADMARAYGAEVRLVPKAPWGDPKHYHQIAQDITAQTPGAVFLDQFNNPANTRAHYDTTGPELWAQTGGRIDALVTGMGTSGTLCGAGRYLKERNPAIKVVCSDPMGSIYFNLMTMGEAKAEGSSILEGVGIGRRPGIFDPRVLDGILRVTDAEALDAMWRIIRKEGLFVGGSAGLSVAGALKLAPTLPPGSTLVTVLCDSGRNSMSKVFNPEWLRAQGLPPGPS
ncbi:MAG: cysteine synthase A [Candidatus Polarisedimenticolia bacterium]